MTEYVLTRLGTSTALANEDASYIFSACYNFRKVTS